ncbi:hypothetical protein [Allokutzneria oryzae]|uniref:Uncharacterized protein n=1 Tax=Allokutzneria oryzae TaxID=1378989 RepID=A0ABV6A478_9PSEU
MWFYILLGLVVVGVVVAAVLDSRAKKVRGELKPSSADPDGHVSKIEPGYVLPNPGVVTPHTDS